MARMTKSQKEMWDVLKSPPPSKLPKPQEETFQQYIFGLMTKELQKPNPDYERIATLAEYVK